MSHRQLPPHLTAKLSSLSDLSYHTSRAIHKMPVTVAIAQLDTIPCPVERQIFVQLIAGIWRARDINRAWSAVTRSTLDATTKQALYNELWS
jgi:hypothetical protein